MKYGEKYTVYAGYWKDLADIVLRSLSEVLTRI